MEHVGKVRSIVCFVAFHKNIKKCKSFMEPPDCINLVWTALIPIYAYDYTFAGAGQDFFYFYFGGKGFDIFCLSGDTRIWTGEKGICSPPPYHSAMPPKRYKQNQYRWKSSFGGFIKPFLFSLIWIGSYGFFILFKKDKILLF